MSTCKLFELKLFARLLKAFIESKDKDTRTIAKKWLDIVETEINTQEEAHIQYDD